MPRRSQRPFATSFRADQRARQARDDFVLHVEEIGEGLIEPLGPEMTAGFGVDELHIDAHAIAAAMARNSDERAWAR